MADSIASASDAELLNIATQVLTVITPAPAIYGLDAAFMAKFTTGRDTYEIRLGEHVAAQATAKAKTITKDVSRDDVEGLLRDVRISAKAAKTPAEDVAALGIPSSSDPAPPNATVPIGQIDTSKRMEHTISFRDAASEDTKKKPRGVVGCEIWVKIGEPAPGNQKDCAFLGLDTKTPYTAIYDPADGGKTAYYMLRWAMRDGSVSAWGETISATITA